ncbi:MULTISPECIES: hypothetical protein [Streptomyces]
MDPYAYACAAALAAWLLLSAAAQLGPLLPRLKQWHQRYDPLGFVPRYHFFAPRPGTYDYHLLVRTGPDGTPSFGPWRELAPPRRRRWWHVLWNPDRRQRKQLFDLTMRLCRADARCEDPATPLSIPYLLLLGHAGGAVGDDGQVQFMIARSAGYRRGEPPQAVFVSRPHRLGTG